MMILACVLTSGRGLMCKDQIGGARYVFFANFDPALVHQFTVTDKVITAAPVMTAYRYDLQEGAGGVVSTINASVENGTRFYEQVIDVSFNKLDPAMQAEMDLLSAAKMWVWIEDGNKNVILYGYENGCDVTGGTIDTGKARGDKTGYALTVTGKERLSAPFATPYTDFAFDTLPEVTVDPPFPVIP